MKFRGTIAAAGLAIGALTIGSTVAYAEPTPAPAAPASADQGVSYSVKLAEKTVVATLRNGTFELTEQEGATPEDPKQTLVNVKDVSGTVVNTFPLEFEASGTEIPVKPVVKEDGKVLEVNAEKPEGLQPVSAPVAARPIASALENQRAMNEFSSKFGLATAIGGFVGTAIGLLVGCFAGLGIGCLPGAGIGGIIGTIVAGGPTLVAAGIELIQTLQAPDGTTKWAN